MENSKHSENGAQLLDMTQFDKWAAADKANQQNVKKCTRPETRLRIEQAEQLAYDELLSSLPTAEETNLRMRSVQETTEDIKE